MQSDFKIAQTFPGVSTETEGEDVPAFVESKSSTSQIRKDVLSIIENRSGVDFQTHPEWIDEPLLGEQIRLPSRELLWIYFDLEKAVGISIQAEEIEAGNFKTAGRIVDCVTKAIMRSNSIQ